MLLNSVGAWLLLPYRQPVSERTNDGIERSAAQWFKRYNAKEPEKGGARKTMATKPRDWLEQTREGTVKLSEILGFWRRNRSSVERRINNLGSGQGAD